MGVRKRANNSILFDKRTGKTYTLNLVATRVIKTLKTPHTFQDLVKKIATEFNEREEEIRADIFEYLQSCFAENLVEKMNQ